MMKTESIILGSVLSFAAIASQSVGSAQSTLPNPVKTCIDVRAYIGADNSMTMDSFKQLMTAAGNDLSGKGNDALDMQCKVVPYVKNAVIMVQPVMKKSDGSVVVVQTQIILDGGVCKLSKIELSGC